MGDVAIANGAGERTFESTFYNSQPTVPRPALEDRLSETQRAAFNLRFAEIDAKIESASRDVAKAKARVDSFDSKSAEIRKLGKAGEIILAHFADYEARLAALEQRILAGS